MKKRIATAFIISFLTVNTGFADYSFVDPADFVSAGSFSYSAISAGSDLCYISYISDKEETLFIGGLLSAADIFMFLCIYRKYEADSTGQ